VDAAQVLLYHMNHPQLCELSLGAIDS
jgi:hypothetical protein